MSSDQPNWGPPPQQPQPWQQQPQWQPPYQQQWGAPPPPPPPPPKRHGLLIGGLIVVLLAITAGILVWVSNRGDEPTYQPAPQPTTTSTQPTTSTPTTPAAPDGVSVGTVTTALSGAGFVCSDTATTPLLVVRCFADPALPNGDQRVTLQVPNGSVAYAHIEVNTYDDGAAATRIYKAAVTAVANSLLPTADATVIRTSTTKAPAITWGTATQSQNAKGTSHELTLTAKGARASIQVQSQTKVTVPAATKALRGKGFTCKPPSKYGVTSCTRAQGTEPYSVDLYSPCGTKLEVKGFCQQVGANALFVNAYVGFGRAVTDAVYNRIRNHLQLAADLATGQSSTEVSDWMGKNLDGKAHHTDLEGVHLAIRPGAGGRAHAGANPNVVALEVTGIRPY
ncbi:hypothetical protein OG474_14575 [Kribbella sp. NBC_01505]|uniref:hypothetical protein n=1 Tax=Kribbella sp. NBC_01505 TaxID=2903580 RepID=UPI003868EA76